MGNNNDCSSEAVPKLKNQVIKQRALMGSSPADGSSKKKISGSKAIARAILALFFIPPLISDG